MATVNLSPILNGWQGFDTQGNPLSGGFIYAYQAGTATPLATYTTSAGTITNSNPMILGVDGRPAQEIWLVQGSSYKFVVTDSLSNVISTYDNIIGVNDVSSNLNAIMNAFPNKASPADNDRFPLLDSGAAYASKYTLWSAIKSTLKTYFDPIYAAIAGNAANPFSVSTLTSTTINNSGTTTSSIGNITTLNTTTANITNVTSSLVDAYSTNGKIKSSILYGSSLSGNAPVVGFGSGTLDYGTYTQATSKSTTVVVTTSSGIITMNNASLAGAAQVSFNVNSFIFTNTSIFLVQIGTAPATPYSYSVQAEAIKSGGPGSVVVTLKNNTVGALAEAVDLRYAIVSFNLA